MNPFPFNDTPSYITLHQRELRAQAARDRLARQASLARPASGARWTERPRRWRRQLGTLLIIAGEALMGPAAEAASPHGAVESCCCGL